MLLYITRKYPPSIGGMQRFNQKLVSHLKRLRHFYLMSWGHAQTFMLFFLTGTFFKTILLRAGKKIELQPLEFSLLEYLMRNAGRVVSKTMIMEHVWDYHFDPQTNVVEARISRLRDKIDKGFPTKLIHTVRGVGYVLRESP